MVYIKPNGILFKIHILKMMMLVIVLIVILIIKSELLLKAIRATGETASIAFEKHGFWK